MRFLRVIFNALDAAAECVWPRPHLVPLQPCVLRYLEDSLGAEMVRSEMAIQSINQVLAEEGL